MTRRRAGTDWGLVAWWAVVNAILTGIVLALTWRDLEHPWLVAGLMWGSATWAGSLDARRHHADGNGR